MIKHKNKIIFCLIVVAILAVSFFGGNAPATQISTDVADGNPAGTHLSAEEKLAVAEEIAQNTNNEEPRPADNTAEPEEEPQAPVQTDDTDNTTTCSISVRCDAVLSNMQSLSENKRDIIPDDGIIFENKNAVFYEGESAFNVLARGLKKNKIHFEYTKNPMYDSVYIEGIGNLYEFDCGELSGWLYKVNGKTPGSGCSKYILKNGDTVEFIYTCNMGIDVGGYKDISGE